MSGITVMMLGMGEPLSASVPPDISANGFSDSFNTGIVLCTVKGGVAPYTFLWSKVSGGLISIVTVNNSTTAFEVTGMAVGNIRIANFKCTVTDGAGAVDDSNEITVTMERVA